MTHAQSLSLAYSSCPNDTYIFDALANGRIDTDGLRFSVTLADVETLNLAAAREQYQVTKLSFAAMGGLGETYGLLRTGAALGRGCGPLLITRPGPADFGRRPVIAVPGLGTTACLLLRFFMQDRMSGLEPELRPMPFETIMDSVASGNCHMGVIIHEGRFVYQQAGFSLVQDLGEWWEQTTGLPIPLGCIAILRRLGAAMASRVEELILGSILHADAHPRDGLEYIRRHAQELDDAVIGQHIQLYVNRFSKGLGEEGEAAVRVFLEKGRKAGLIPRTDQPLFAAPDTGSDR